MNPRIHRIGWLGVLVLQTLWGCGRSRLQEPSDLLFLRMTPDNPVCYINQSVQLTVEGRFADGTTRTLTDEPDLMLRTGGNGVVELVGGHGFVAKTAGQTTLTATLWGRKDSIEVTVVYATLTGIRVSPSHLNLQPGEFVWLTVSGILSDGLTLELNSSSLGTSYFSEDESVAMVTVDGLVAAVSEGQTVIQVTHYGFATAAIVKVGSGALLISIELSPAEFHLLQGQQQQLQVIGHVDDGSVLNLTHHPETSFSSSNQTVVSVDSQGLVTGVGGGQAVIRCSHGSFSAQANVSVDTQTELIGIRVEPAEAFLSRGSTLRLKVLADYSDSTSSDVTVESIYRSSNPKVVQVDTSGLLTAQQAGEVQISIEYADQKKTLEVHVQEFKLTELEVDPLTAELSVGDSLSLRVIGTFDNGSQQDLTDSSRGTVYLWDPIVLAIGPNGLLTAISAGQADAQACNSGICAISKIQVNGPKLNAIHVSPKRQVLSLGGIAYLSVWAAYSDGSAKNVTGQSVFRSEAPSVARVSTNGMVSAVGGGETRVQIAFGGLQDDCEVSVTTPSWVSLTVNPPILELDVGQEAELRVQVYSSDGKSQDVTGQASYQSSNPEVVEARPTGGIVALRPGLASVSASFSGLSDSCQVRVKEVTLLSIQIEPEAVQLSPGGTQQFKVSGTYSDGKTRDITEPEWGTTYQSSDPMIVGIDSAGFAWAISPGEVEITASYGNLSDTASVLVTKTP